MSNKDEYIIVSTSVASIYKKPTFTSELVTQALIWEKLIIIKNYMILKIGIGLRINFYN